jgi:hypothetical protein
MLGPESCLSIFNFRRNVAYNHLETTGEKLVRVSVTYTACCAGDHYCLARTLAIMNSRLRCMFVCRDLIHMLV